MSVLYNTNKNICMFNQFFFLIQIDIKSIQIIIVLNYENNSRVIVLYSFI